MRSQLDALCQAASPGYTSRLPGSLIEDVASTNTFSLVLLDQAAVEAVNSLTPYGANEFILNQIGQQYGIPAGLEQNTSVYLVFTGSVGYVVQPGFTASDGTYQYVVQDGGIIATGGQTLPLYAVAIAPGTFAVPAGTVTALSTTVPSTIALSVTNPEPGTPGGVVETSDQYRVRVLEGSRSASSGMPTYVKTLLRAIPGVQFRLVAIRQLVGGGFQVLCGGGDPYLVAGAIYRGVPDFTALSGSAIDGGRNVTVAINDAPDTYSIVFVNPPAQTVDVNCTWNTTATNFVSDNAVNQAASQALVNYVNSLVAGQPINVFQLNQTFLTADANILDPTVIDRLVFTVSINGTGVAPSSGTGLIAGDPESYFEATATSVQVARG